MLHILPLYWHNIAFIGQFTPICAILDQYNANIVCYTGTLSRKHEFMIIGTLLIISIPSVSIRNSESTKIVDRATSF